MPARTALFAILVLAGSTLSAQNVQPTLVVQQVAPQLVQFAGSPLNFQALVNGLAQGTPVQLVSVLPNGSTQLVTFTPGAAMQPADIVGTLERARQQLIALGVGAPTAEQIAVTLMGGTVPTPLGGAPVAGLISPAPPPSPARQAQEAAAAGGTAPGANATAPGVDVQLVPAVPQPPTVVPGVTATVPLGSPPVPRPNISDSPTAPGATSASPIPLIPNNAPGVASQPRGVEPARPAQTPAPRP